ncbi:MAG: flagellar hook basal-body protein, partial [Desulfobacterales bacterium]|nr:flagellar hook basal-body protein [Desulfobacterales bacterium]
MSGALYMAASGAANHQVKMDVLANNLANINTTGFKRELAVFRELAIPGSSAASAAPPSIPGDSYRHLSNIPTRTYTDHSPGEFIHTGNNLDLALHGKGFFCIKTPSGEQYTRKGEFRISEDGL